VVTGCADLLLDLEDRADLRWPPGATGRTRGGGLVLGGGYPLKAEHVILGCQANLATHMVFAFGEAGQHLDLG